MKRPLKPPPLGKWYERGRSDLNGLQLGFAATNPGEIRRGVRELAIALEDARTRRF
jgi:DNA-binding transcriptional MocR family regulator